MQGLEDSSEDMCSPGICPLLTGTAVQHPSEAPLHSRLSRSGLRATLCWNMVSLSPNAATAFMPPSESKFAHFIHTNCSVHLTLDQEPFVSILIYAIMITLLLSRDLSTVS